MGTEALVLSACKVDFDLEIVERADERLALTTREAKLLAYLAAHPRVDLSRDELHAKVWGYGESVVSRAVDCTVNRLRQKIEEDPAQPRHLLTVYGHGYRFVPDLAQDSGAAPEDRPRPRGEDREAPPRRAEPRRARTNLRSEPNVFIGREVELQALADLLAERRVVTVVGPPGAGKTRLARHHAADRLNSGEVRSAWLCDLSEALSASDVLQALARALDISVPAEGAGGAALAERLGHAIAGQGSTLLVIDNAEQVAEQLAALLPGWWQAAPDARFLVTSRAPLRIPIEQQLPLGPLRVPTAAASVEILAENEAVTLFAERARAVRPSFELDKGNAADVAAIVVELDGLPLALELAAARLRMWTPSTLRARLRDRFRVLVRSASEEPRRAANLRDALQWSWELLSPWEQSALAQCSVFRGGFTWEAAEAVVDLAAWPEAPWIVDVLGALVESSLLRVGEVATESRLEMLVSVAAFAAEMLAQQGSDARPGAQARHAAHYATYGAEEFTRSLSTHGGLKRRAALFVELENLVVATERALRAGWSTWALDACFAATEIRLYTGPAEPRIALADRVLERCAEPARMRARLLNRHAHSLRLTGRVDEARRHLEEALAIARAAADRGLQGAATCNLGHLARLSGMSAEARDLYDQALAIFVAIHDPCSEAMVRGALGALGHAGGSLEEARIHTEQAMELLRAAGDRHNAALMQGNLANLLELEGRPDEAARHNTQALAVLHEVGDRTGEGRLLGNLAGGLRARSSLDDARVRYQEALAISREVGNRGSEGHLLGNLAAVHQEQGDDRRAREYCDMALAIHREIGDRAGEDWVLATLARLDGDQPGASP